VRFFRLAVVAGDLRFRGGRGWGGGPQVRATPEKAYTEALFSAPPRKRRRPAAAIRKIPRPTTAQS